MDFLISHLALYLVLLCHDSEGASVKYKGEKAPETIVAVTGVSPTIIDTALSLLENNGKNSNWHLPNNLMLGGLDKVFPFPMQMMDAPKPFKPVSPSPPGHAAAKPPVSPQSTAGEKDQPGKLVPLTPLMPLKPVEAVATPDVQTEEKPAVVAPPLESNVVSLPEPEYSPENVDIPPSLSVPVLEAEPVPEVANEQPLEETIPSSPEVLSVPQSTTGPGWSSQTGSGWSQGSSGGQNAGGNQILSMNLNANLANFQSTNNMNMHVVSDGTSESNTYVIGSKTSDPSHLHGQTHGAITKYIIQFKSTDDKDLTAPSQI